MCARVVEGETELDSSVRLFRDTFFPSFRSETRTIIRSFVEKGFQSDVRMCMYAFCEFSPPKIFALFLEEVEYRDRKIGTISRTCNCECWRVTLSKNDTRFERVERSLESVAAYANANSVLTPIHMFTYVFLLLYVCPISRICIYFLN